MNKQVQIKLETELEYLKLPWLKENYKSATEEAAKKTDWTPGLSCFDNRG